MVGRESCICVKQQSKTATEVQAIRFLDDLAAMHV